MSRRHPRLLPLVAVAAVVLAVTACACGANGDDENVQTYDGLSILAIAPPGQSGSEGSLTSLTLDGPLETLPEKAMVYATVIPEVAPESVVKLAGGLGVAGEANDSQGYVRVAEDGTSFVVFKDSGSFDYITRALDEQSDPIDEQLTDGEYRAKAETFLKQHGLWQDQAEFREVRAQTVETWVDGQAVTLPYLVQVAFGHRPLDGIPYDGGVGPRIAVSFGDGGKILGASSIWRSVKPLSEYPLESLEQAVARVEKGEGVVQGLDAGGPGSVSDVTLAYISDPAGYPQRYVLPWYVMRGVANGDDTFVALVPAVAPKYVEYDPEIARPVL